MSASKWLVPAFLSLCIMLGGASAAGYLANAGLQLCGIGLLLIAFLSRNEAGVSYHDRSLLLVLILAFLLVALQVLPLPVGLWRSLPGREQILSPLVSAGTAFPFGFVSLIPHESLKSAVWLLPPLGVLFVMLRNSRVWSGRRIAVALTATMCVAVVLGAMQRAAGPSSPLYFYHFTNRGTAVGFFANANHMASLLLVTIPFQTALLREALDRGGKSKVAAVASLSGSLAVTATGVVVVGSLAGYGLLVPVAIASALILRKGEHVRLTIALTLVLAVVGAMALILATPSGRMLLDQASGMSEGSRSVIFARTWTAIHDFWPAGTGLGTFAEVYPSYEDPLTVTRTYINHAHNDYLELLLEFGVAGLIVLSGFLLWWATRCYGVWRRPSSASPFAKAAAVASATLLVHSLVDYPLRTAALSSVFAACLALLVTPHAGTRKFGRQTSFSLKGKA